jgi:hypothetical protein
MMQNQINEAIKKFLSKITIFVISLIILDFLLGSILKHYYFKQKSGELYLATYVIDSTKADILVFGSSRANHHYVPAVFERKLHATFYNCGRDGCNFIYSAALISAVIERYTPKRIIIDILPDEFSNSEDGKLSPLLPYQYNPFIKPFIQYNSKFESYKLFSKIYPYNSLLTTIVKGNISLNKEEDNGYIPLYQTMPFYPKPTFISSAIIKERVHIFNNLLQKLNDKHINTSIVISPSYYSFHENNQTKKIINDIIKNCHYINFLNYENAPKFARHEIYQDSYHLNFVGANKFSNDFTDKLINRSFN